MKLGFVSAILADLSFEEMIDFASENGYECVEVACWPKGKAERRYAGVTHINVDEVDEAKAAYINDYCAKKGVEISALAYYPNTMDPDLEKRAVYIAHIKKVIKAAKLLGVGTVNTFVGRDPHKNVDENIEIFKEVWPDIIACAEENGIRIGIENCPMLFTNDEWPGGQNLMTTPAIWRKLFEIIPSKNFGLNYDPSHFVWQQIDYIRPIYEFKDRIFHVHYKDIKVYPDKLRDVALWRRLCSTCLPSCPALAMWTGANMCPP